jgi:hypothetical protein
MPQNPHLPHKGPILADCVKPFISRAWEQHDHFFAKNSKKGKKNRNKSKKVLSK